MADQNPKSEDTIQGFIFARELAEVYLLLDNIAIDEGKSLPNLDNEPPFGGPTTAGAPRSWIEQICDIGWPPPDGRANKASDAAKLLRAKEKLNIAATPATGYTIAFTFLIAGESTHRQTVLDRLEETRRRGKASWWAGLAYLLFHDAGREEDRLHDREIEDGWGARPPSRGALARMAFPNLGAKARRYRKTFSRGVIGMILWLLMVCFLSWDLATGSALLNRTTTIATAQETVANQIAVKEDAINHPSSPKDGIAKAIAPPSPPYAFCADHGLAPSGADGEERRLCDSQNKNEAMFVRAVEDLKNWVEKPGWARWALSALYSPPGLETRTLPPADAVPPQKNLTARMAAYVDAASVLLGVLAGVILPILYGVLGAGTAILRSLSAKMRDSTLSPRDLVLAPIQLALGAVIGGCVGLFVSPGGAAGAAEPGLLGPVHLSASALCFIAGFGVEGVFVALESFVKRVFNLKP